VTLRRTAGGRNSDVGLFAADDWTLGDLVLTAGFRADRWVIADGFFREVTAAGVVSTDARFADRAGWETSVRGGVVWKAAPSLALRGAIYTGPRLPTINELYRPFVVSPVTTRANAALRNERVFGFEGGIDWTPSPSAAFSLTLFENRVRDAIANVTIGTNLRERQNVDAIRARGIELSGSLKSGAWSLDGALALTDAEVEASGAAVRLNGLRPAQTPSIAASATLSWRPREGWLVSATLRHVGAQYEDDLQTDLLPAATTLDFFAEVPVSPRFSLILRGENLTDTDIVTRNQAGSIDLGAPRTVWAGIRVKLPQ
jgi:outer membrane receptor protein involved in Fe transport